MEGLERLHDWILEPTIGWTGGLVAVGVAAFILPIVLLLRSELRDRHKRGARVVRAQTAWRRVLNVVVTSGEPSLRLAGVRIGCLDETKHFKLIGTTGTGKSTAIRALLRRALERGDRAVISDPDGGYLLSFYNRYRGDTVLNPFEQDAVKWNPFAEIQNLYDIDQLAGGLIPSTDDPSGREWRGYARTFLTAVLRRCHERGSHDVAELWRLLAIAPSSELRPIVFDTPAQPFLEPENARMFGSIRSVAASAAAALAYVKDQRAKPFSVRKWVQAGRGVLFIPYKAAQIAALRSIIATWMRLAIVETMSFPEQDQRLWLIVDELDALGAIDGLKDALARLRKFGGRCVLGFQSIAQVSSTYGAGEAQTIVENCGNTLILRCSGSENGGTSHFASRLIGEREVIRRQTSRGRDRDGSFFAHGTRRSRNISEQHVTEAAVMASELEQLPDLTGYLKTASAAQWLRVELSR
jgi:type IV secretory pathway TraG/TraD family ATPase VirD4